MLDKLKAVLEEKYIPWDLISQLQKAKTNDEILAIGHQIKARIEAVEAVNFSLLKVLKEQENEEAKKSDS